jgi:hypothetical protein
LNLKLSNRFFLQSLITKNLKHEVKDFFEIF